MSNQIRVAILGLGEAGEAFAEHLLEKIQIEKKPVVIVAVADPDNLNSPVALGFSQNKVPVLGDYMEIVHLADDIDIIFDLSGDVTLPQKIRLELLARKNRHTTIASEEVARLLWYFFDEQMDLPRVRTKAAA